ncbi:MAG: GldG family protein [gamma proteobacterium symbiont of Bathyaustriella thionipta]|nr:GldG family protein [gamma proteobacterium symbiont of Bathyaustriella thionipta]
MRTFFNKLNRYAFYPLLLLLAFSLLWLAQRYHWQWDWTHENRNSLSEQTLSILHKMQQPLRIESYVNDSPLLRQQIRTFFKRYQQAKPDISLKLINPDLQPEKARNMGVTVNGELVIHYQGRMEKLRELNEQHLANALQRLLINKQHWIIGLSGNGERKLLGNSSSDLGKFSQELKRKGYHVQQLNPSQSQSIPDNTTVLLIAGPRINYLPGQWRQIENWLNRGGNLLWLMDYSDPVELDKLGQWLGIDRLPGLIVDAGGSALGVQDPTIALVSDYPEHEATRDLKVLSLFPRAVALAAILHSGWQATPILQTGNRSWNETGPLQEAIKPDAADEHVGPLTLGMALQRDQMNKKQRVVVIGNGHFLANSTLGNGGNLPLGLNLIHWLSGEQQQLDIPLHSAADRTLKLGKSWTLLFGLGFLFMLPLLLISSGLIIRYRRNKR